MLTLTRQSVFRDWLPVTACVFLAHRPSLQQKTKNPLTVFSKYHLWERRQQPKEIRVMPATAPPCATSCSQAGKLIFSWIRISSRATLSLAVLIYKAGGSRRDRSFGEQANYLGVLSNLKSLNPPPDKVLCLRHRWPLTREDGELREQVDLLIASFMGT